MAITAVFHFPPLESRYVLACLVLIAQGANLSLVQGSNRSHPAAE